MSGLAGRLLRPVDAERLAQARTVLHVSFGAEAEFHVHMWVPFLSAVDSTYVIVVRSTGLFLRLRRRSPHLPVVLLRSGREVGDFVMGAEQLRVILYASNSGNVLDFVRHEELRHVFIGHGDSDKVASTNRFFRLYDEIWVSGQAQVDRLAGSGNIGPGQSLELIGRPVVRSLLAASSDNVADGPIGIMPTWEGPYDGQNYSSARLTADIVRVATQATGRPALVKMHPWTGRRDAGLAKVEDQISAVGSEGGPAVTIIPRARPSDTVMGQTSLLVSDVSSITVDYLLTGRALFVYLPTELAERVRSGVVPITDYAYTFSTTEELGALLRAVVGGEDPLAQRREVARDYLVDVAATSEGRFEELLHGLLEGEPR